MTSENNDLEEAIEDYSKSESEEFQIDEYDVTSSPNDFNVITIYNYIKSGAIVIPSFQRNYVWDIKRASKLIESLILGLPVPQIFLYEKERNKFYVIDGQQRLMSIYYFLEQRFPKKEKRSELRKIFDQNNELSTNIIQNDEYFTDFKLTLPEISSKKPNKFKGKKYHTLSEYKTQLDLRPIRIVIVKQNKPENDDSAMFEIFNRLNTGGVNLKPQEIRASLHDSDFYAMLHSLNTNENWRKLINSDTPDIHMSDIEIILRAFAFLIDKDNYAPSLPRFLNQFSKKAKSYNLAKNKYLGELFVKFIFEASQVSEKLFFLPTGKKFNLALFEACFVGSCLEAFKNNSFSIIPLSEDKVRAIADDKDFKAALHEGTTKAANVAKRLNQATTILSS